MNVLVTGFGPFPGVSDNPTAALARALDGMQIGAARVIGRVLPVSYRRGPAEAVRLARAHDARLVLGTGVAANRATVCVERVAVRMMAGRPDVDGLTDTGLVGDDRVNATIDTAGLAAALGALSSDDAGSYVCNAWLYRVVKELDVPVGFVHVPATGIAIERVVEGIRRLVG